MSLGGLIFDLDDTLLDTSSLLIPIAHTRDFERRIREPLPLMEGALENLEILSKKYHLSLVTQGVFQIQRIKIQSLSIEKYFKHIEIVETPVGKSKLEAFRRVSTAARLHADQLLSVGNRRSTDLRFAKRLGMFTCLFAHGEHVEEKPECPEDFPDFEVSHHRDLIRICGL